MISLFWSKSQRIGRNAHIRYEIAIRTYSHQEIWKLYQQKVQSKSRPRPKLNLPLDWKSCTVDCQQLIIKRKKSQNDSSKPETGMPDNQIWPPLVKIVKLFITNLHEIYLTETLLSHLVYSFRMSENN